MLSALTMTPLCRAASSNANADLPLAVGPVIRIAFIVSKAVIIMDLVATLIALHRTNTGYDMRHVLAIDLPMRVLVWADDAGKVFVTRSTGADIAHRVFARHGMDIGDDGQIATDRMFAELLRQASE